MIMRKIVLSALLLTVAVMASGGAEVYKPWSHGRLTVSDNRRFIVHDDGTPFFWLGNTAWLMPQRLTRDEVVAFLTAERLEGFNVEQVQVINAIPTFNAYGRQANDSTFDCAKYTVDGDYGYWEHLDYIVDVAADNGIYIAMVCVWGSQVAYMDEAKAASLGTFLASRYKDKPNIIWVIGGDIRGDKRPEVWDALARAIKNADDSHLMTFHPRGRTTSAQWFNGREWLDFNMFQSGHRRYWQRMGDADYPIEEGTEEDNWRYVDMSTAHEPLRPVLDGEPSYEDIPQGLHDVSEPRWQACDVRRYAYWSVFGGSCGHTYGHNSIMQFFRPGLNGAYGADKPWWDALKDAGRCQMKYLKWLILAFPFTDRVADQSIIVGTNGERYDRIAATRGNDYLFVYNYSGKPMTVDLTRISGDIKNVWWLDPASGSLSYVGQYASQVTVFAHDSDDGNAADCVLIAVDANMNYIDTTATALVERY